MWPSRATPGDFTTDARRLLLLSALAVPVGCVAALLAKFLLVLIGTMTNLAYFGHVSSTLVQPDPRRLGPISILIPVVGGLVVGLIARFGTDKIRGHGIPEAIQSILEGDSVIDARVAFWKPIASAITIGTGGPFGAEGPIIMTGGAFGSLFSQYLHLSSMERRTLLVAGAAGGMAATFGAPIASVLIAVELLLFEWRPRSFVPVAVAAFVAATMRVWLIGSQPPFLVEAPHGLTAFALPVAVAVGLGGGFVSMCLTKLVYLTEDAYATLPIHWMWWPTVGGLVVGLGGWFVPQALGVGYPTIDALVNGHLTIEVVVAIAIVKTVIWIVSLSSGTSGGVLAPLLMIGATLGTVFAQLIPGHDAATWAIVGMAALLGGTMRAPFMGTLFALETTHAWPLAPVVFAACVAATAFTVVFVPRSILTEKLARRGLHVSREYAVHPFELIATSAVMEPVDSNAPRPRESIAAGARVDAAATLMAERGLQALAVIDEAGVWVGTFTTETLLEAWRQGLEREVVRNRIRRFRRAKAGAES